MADISKINAVALADIAKLDAVLAANIAKVNGLVFTTAGIAAPAAAYSVRLLDSSVGVPTYTGAAMRVRRDTAGGTGDDDEADIAFDSGIVSLDSAISNASVGVTATTLGQFLNVGTVNGTTYTNPDSLTVTASCFVDEWKDQSGNANHASQATQGNQPQIHDGTVNTDLITENGKPAIKPTVTDHGLDFTIDISSGEYSMFFAGQAVLRATIFASYGSGSQYAMFANSGASTNTFGTLSNTSLFVDGTASSIATAGDAWTAFNNNQSLITLFADHTWTSGNLAVGYSNVFSGMYQTQEFILYTDDQSSNRTAIETNINSDYLIYQPTDAPTSGLLATYTGAAAAYSVRQLSDKAVLCMRIRRDMGVGNPGDDDETNIGFDANGDLDTQAIADFCGTGTGYVTRWWDQSVNSNHAEQDGQGEQPQIYNGTAVITENGKPAIQADDSPSNLSMSSTSVGSAFIVYRKTADKVLSTLLGGTSAQQIDGGGTATSLNRAIAMSDGSTIVRSTTLANNTTQHLGSVHVGTDAVRLDGVQEASNTSFTTLSVARIFQRDDLAGNSSFVFVGRMQEVVVYGTEQDSTNITGIETNINDYFDIYT